MPLSKIMQVLIEPLLREATQIELCTMLMESLKILASFL